MKKGFKVSKGYAVFFLLLISVVVWWKVSYPSYSFHYKITVEIETPEGIKSGSAVREVTVGRQPPIGDAPSIIFDVRGEAVVVDLGQRGVVFSLINWDSDRDVFYALNTIEKNELRTGLKGMLPQAHYPQFVMFKDINDPKSVTLVLGGQFNKETQKFDPVNDFEKLFGAGVKLKEITIEITDESVTWGVDKVLSWVPNVLMSNIDGTSVTSENKLSNILHGGNFRTGLKR